MRVISALSLGAFSLVLAGCQTTETGYSAADEALYLERYNAFFVGGARGLDVYDPLAPVPGADPVEPLPVAETTTISQTALDEAIEYAGAMNSSALIVWQNGAVVSENYFGETTRESQLISRSLAKPIATIAVGRAIAEGYITSLDQPAADFIPEWAGDDRSKILIRHILDMRTGLLPQALATEAEDILNRSYMHPRHDEIIINDYPLIDEPGSRYEYANANSELVAPLIERATGMSYQDWVSSQVFQPLGARGGEVWVNRPGGTAHSGCCMMVPAETFLRLAILLLEEGEWNGSQLLPDGFVEQVRTATPQNPYAGMGVYVAGKYTDRRGAMNPDMPFGRNLHSEPYLASDLYLFDGNSHQVGYIIPSVDLVILRTGVTPDEGLEWDNARLPNTILSGMTFEPGSGPVPQPYGYTDTRTEIAGPEGRAIPLRVLEPQNCQEPCPLMVFSHGAFSTYDRYDELLVPLVEAGYRVAAPNHVDSEEHPDRENYGQADSMAKRLEDYTAIASHFSAERTIAIGHSYGGLIAQVAGGAQLSGPGAALGIDPGLRPEAIVAISPPGPFPGGIDAEGWSKIERPMLAVTGTTDILPGFVDDWRLHLVSYEASQHPETFALVYDDMDHYLNGAYGRETDLQGEALKARTEAMAHLITATDAFLNGINTDGSISEEAWKALETPAVETMKR